MDNRKENFKTNIKKLSLNELLKLETYLKNKREGASTYEGNKLYNWMEDELREEILDRLLSGE